MTTPASGPAAPPAFTVPDRLAAACSAFEDRWRRGERGSIEEFLEQTRPDDRTTLLTLLIRIEVRERVRRGETPRPDTTRAERRRGRSLQPN